MDGIATGFMSLFSFFAPAAFFSPESPPADVRDCHTHIRFVPVCKRHVPDRSDTDRHGVIRFDNLVMSPFVTPPCLIAVSTEHG
jgi:hypothetical protein